MGLFKENPVDLRACSQEIISKMKDDHFCRSLHYTLNETDIDQATAEAMMSSIGPKKLKVYDKWKNRPPSWIEKTVSIINGESDVKTARRAKAKQATAKGSLDKSRSWTIFVMSMLSGALGVSLILAVMDVALTVPFVLRTFNASGKSLLGVLLVGAAIALSLARTIHYELGQMVASKVEGDEDDNFEFLRKGLKVFMLMAALDAACDVLSAIQWRYNNKYGDQIIPTDIHALNITVFGVVILTLVFTLATHPFMRFTFEALRLKQRELVEQNKELREAKSKTFIGPILEEVFGSGSETMVATK